MEVPTTRRGAPLNPRFVGILRLMIEILHYLKTLSYGNDGIFLTMGHAGFLSSTVV